MVGHSRIRKRIPEKPASIFSFRRLGEGWDWGDGRRKIRVGRGNDENTVDPCTIPVLTVQVHLYTDRFFQ